MNPEISTRYFSTHSVWAARTAMENVIQDSLFPVPLYANELPVGAITIVHIGERGHFFAKKTSSGHEEVSYENTQLAEVWLVSLQEALKQGWVVIRAAPPRQVPRFT